MRYSSAALIAFVAADSYPISLQRVKSELSKQVGRLGYVAMSCGRSTNPVANLKMPDFLIKGMQTDAS